MFLACCLVRLSPEGGTDVLSQNRARAVLIGLHVGSLLQDVAPEVQEALSATQVAGVQGLSQRLQQDRLAPGDAARERELDLGVVELLHVDALGQGCGHGRGLDDLQAGRAHPVPGRHFLQVQRR